MPWRATSLSGRAPCPVSQQGRPWSGAGEVFGPAITALRHHLRRRNGGPDRAAATGGSRNYAGADNAYDRGGYSRENVEKLKEKGVEQVGLAPRGKAKWAVAKKVKDKLVNERAQVEGSIGTVKSDRYGFNRPRARSAEMMGVCGQRAVLGLNLNKVIRGLAERNEVVLVG